MEDLIVPSISMPVMDLYEQSATGLLTVRCPGCHSPHSSYITDDLVDCTDRGHLLEQVFEGLGETHVAQVIDAWKRYEACRLSPEDFMNILIAARYVPYQKLKAEKERKEREEAAKRKVQAALKEKAPQTAKKWIQVGHRWVKNPEYRDPEALSSEANQHSSSTTTRASAQESSSVSNREEEDRKYGPDIDLTELFNIIKDEEFPKYQLQAPDYLAKFFLLEYTDKAGESGAMSDSLPLKGCLFPQLIEDSERRLALQLAFVRRFPFLINLGCTCSEEICFKCKISEHHDGETCEEKQKGMCDVDAQFCPGCGVPTIRTEGCSSMICICGTYWEWEGDSAGIPEEYNPCWGGETIVYTPTGEKRLKDVKVGEEVLTVKGTFRAIAKKWGSEIGRSPAYQSGRVECARIRGFWITSHHPVLQGNDWRFPAEMASTTPAVDLYNQGLLHSLWNLELEGHNDTIILGSDSGPRNERLHTISCTIGKYLGSRFGYSIFTRRTTRCKHPCAQCKAVHDPSVNFSQLPNHLRWKQFDPFDSLEWTGPLEWGGDEWMEAEVGRIVEKNTKIGKAFAGSCNPGGRKACRDVSPFYN